jgi:uncharacterized protein YfaS (alpha-2-macroglobulin family)
VSFHDGLFCPGPGLLLGHGTALRRRREEGEEGEEGEEEKEMKIRRNVITGYWEVSVYAEGNKNRSKKDS